MVEQTLFLSNEAHFATFLKIALHLQKCNVTSASRQLQLVGDNANASAS
jgi:hypothetical protein